MHRSTRLNHVRYSCRNGLGLLIRYFKPPLCRVSDDLIKAIGDDIRYAQDQFLEPDIASLATEHPYWADVTTQEPTEAITKEGDVDPPIETSDPPIETSEPPIETSESKDG